MYSFHPNSGCVGTALWAGVYQRTANESCTLRDGYYKWANNGQFVATPAAHQFPATLSAFIAFFRYTDTSCTTLSTSLASTEYFQEGRCVRFSESSEKAYIVDSSVVYEIYERSSTCTGTPNIKRILPIGSCSAGFWALYSGNLATTADPTSVAVGVAVPLALICLLCIAVGIFLMICLPLIFYCVKRRRIRSHKQPNVVIAQNYDTSPIASSIPTIPTVPTVMNQPSTNPYLPLMNSNNNSGSKGSYPIYQQVSSQTPLPQPVLSPQVQPLSLSEPVLLQTQKHNHSYTTDYTVDFKLLDFKDSKILGGGGQGIVVTAKYYNSPVAVKFFSKTLLAGTDSSSVQEFYNEARFLAQYSNFVNIIRFIGVAEDPAENKICIVTELLPGGNLANWVESASLTLDEKVSLLFGIANGMQYLHSHNIIHRDLKCENVLLDESHKVPKIMDFGFSKQMENINKSMNMTYNVGTAAYIAPEVIAKEMDSVPESAIPSLENAGSTEYSNNSVSTTSSGFSIPKSDTSVDTKKQYDKKADVYSFAIIMYVLYTENRNPYGKQISSLQIMNQMSKNPHFRPRLPENIPQEHEWYINLMQRCWKTNPARRPDFEEISFILEKHLKT